MKNIIQLSYRTTNIIHTDPGVLQGFIIKYVRVYGVIFKKWVVFRIPIWFLGYDKKEAQSLHKTIEELRQSEIPVTKQYMEDQLNEEK